MLREWKQYFREVILERGEDYYYGGRVDRLKKTDYGYSAVVHGNDDYEVDIYLKGDSVEDMDCDCAHAYDGHNCKHMAAVLFTIDDPYCDEEIMREETEENILLQLDEETLRDELRKILDRDSDLKQYIIQKYRTTPLQTYEIKNFRKDLEQLSYEVGDRYGFIDWRSGSEYVQRFCGYLEDFLSPVIERGEYMTAFQALAEAFEVVNTVEMDGSCGEHQSIADTILDMWESVIDGACEQERDQMYEWFLGMKNRGYDILLSDDIDYALQHFFTDEKYMLPLLQEVRNTLNPCPADSYLVKEQLSLYEEYLGKLGLPLDEMNQWIENNKDREPVIEWLIEKANKENDYPGLIELLQKLLAMQKEKWQKTNILYQLKEAYRRNDDPVHEREYLAEYMLSGGRCDWQDVMKLKKLSTPEQWIEYRTGLIRQNPDLRPALYYEDDMFEELISILPQYPVSAADAYRKVLQEIYPEEISDIYLSHLEKLLERHPSVSLYTEMKKYLLILGETDIGKRIFQNLRTALPERYPTRKSLHKTLEEAARLLYME